MNNKPNVIMILTDDQGFGDMACHGNPVAVTPEMDRLHDESVRLNDFHAAPMCTPTRGQMMSGLDACRNGALNVSSGRTLLRADLTTLADIFKDGGYRTGLFGKWHLGDNYPYRPQDRGFEESVWFPSSHISSVPDYWLNDYFDDVYMHNGKREHFEGYCTQVFFEKAKKWIGERVENGESFFTYLPTNAPHGPHFVPEEDRLLLEKKFEEHGDDFGLPENTKKALIRFLAMIRNVDTEIGNLREFLAELGIDKNTIFIFMTDNGSTFGPRYFNAGMKGGKVTLWEGGHRVPCFIHWPEGNIGEARDVDGLTEFQDLMPTLADWCGLELPEYELDGVNLSPVLAGKEEIDKERMLMINYSRMPNTDYPTPDARCYVRPDEAAVCWKRWRLLEGKELYNLDEDPLQDNNVIGKHRDIAEKMQKAHDVWWEKVEPYANEVQNVIIGSEKENPMMLSACEWQDVFVDQQGQIRYAAKKNGYWNLEVERAGTYTFELARYPKESGLKMTDAAPEVELADGHLNEGNPLPIAKAKIMIDRKEQMIDVSPDDTVAKFTVELDKGKVLLHTWLLGGDKQQLCGAFYVYVERITA